MLIAVWTTPALPAVKILYSMKYAPARFLSNKEQIQEIVAAQNLGECLLRLKLHKVLYLAASLAGLVWGLNLAPL